SEGAVAAGVRRIEALAADAALDYLAGQERTVRHLAELLRVGPGEVEERVAALIEERRRLERELSQVRQQLAAGAGQGPQAKAVNGIKLAARRLDGVPPKELRGMVDAAKKQIGSGIVLLIAVNEG